MAHLRESERRLLYVVADATEQGSEEGERRLYSKQQAADRLGGISLSGVDRLIERGDLFKVKVLGRAMVTSDSLQAYMDRLVEEEKASRLPVRIGSRRRA